MTSAEDVIEALRPVQDPEYPISIVDPRVKIVVPEYVKVDSEEKILTVLFKPTAPYCPMGGLIGVLIRHRLEQVWPEFTIRVKVLPGSHSQEEAVNDMISDNEKYQNIIAQLQERSML
ncbi:MAG: hypothetical protein ACTSYL_02075 [Candidatus Thorarchaeota archaeon]